MARLRHRTTAAALLALAAVLLLIDRSFRTPREPEEDRSRTAVLPTAKVETPALPSPAPAPPADEPGPVPDGRVVEETPAPAAPAAESPPLGAGRGDRAVDFAGTIRGRVLDERGDPIRDWWIMGYPGPWEHAGTGAVLECVTDADGAFALRNLSPLVYELFVRDSKHAVPSLVVPDVRTGGEPLEIRVPDSARPTAGIRGVLLGPDREVLEGAWVTLLPDRARLLSAASARPDSATGAFEKGALPPGRYRFSYGSKAMGLRCDRIVELSAEQVLDLGEIRMDAPARLVPVLTPPGDRPTDMEVYFSLHRRLDGGEWFPAGNQTVDYHSVAKEFLLGPGEYRLRLAGNFTAAAEFQVHLDSGQETRLEIPLRRAPLRFLRLRGPSVPPSATWVHARILDGAGLSVHELRWGRASPAVDIVGYASLLPGTYDLEVTPQGGETIRRKVTVEGQDGTDARAPIEVALR